MQPRRPPTPPQLPGLDRLFRSAEDCAQLWKLIGCDYKVVQVSAGTLQGRFRVDREHGITLVSMLANQSLLLQGSRNPRCLPFTIEHTNNFAEHRHFGEKVLPNTLGGFNLQMKDSMIRTSPGRHHIAAVLLDRRRVEELSELGPGGPILDHLESNNAAILTPELHQRLRKLMSIPPWRGRDATQTFLQADFLEAQLLECLSLSSDSCLKPVVQTNRSELVKEFVEFSFQNSTDAINLYDVCKTLFATKTTLTVSCREMFGFGPMALMRRIRLQQVHHVLSHPDLQLQLCCSAVQDVAEYFGFVSRNHFARAYRDLFQESPRQTLLASRSKDC